jgi:hypothetical protein
MLGGTGDRGRWNRIPIRGSYPKIWCLSSNKKQTILPYIRNFIQQEAELKTVHFNINKRAGAKPAESSRLQDNSAKRYTFSQ